VNIPVIIAIQHFHQAAGYRGSFRNSLGYRNIGGFNRRPVFIPEG
jgi:hypothetical protein